MSQKSIEQGTIFQGRYRFESERPLSVGVCDCGGRYAIVVREYTDLHNRNEQGQYSRVETSVRTSCHCAKERDPFRVEQKPANVLNVTGDWRLEKVQRPIYRIHEGGHIEVRKDAT